MEKEWVVIFLIYADFRQGNTGTPNGMLNKELMEEYNSLIKDLRTCNLQDEMKILLIQNIIMPDAGGNIQSDKTTVSYFEKTGSCKNKRILLENLPLIKNPLQKKDQIGKILRKIDSNEYTAAGYTKGKKYCLVTWDHGSAFGIFKRVEKVTITKETKAIRFQNVSVEAENNVSTFDTLHVNEGGYNMVKQNDGTYKLVPRATGAGAMHFFDPQNKFLFATNPTARFRYFAHSVLAEPAVSTSLRLSITEDAIQITPGEEQPNSLSTIFKRSARWQLFEESGFLHQSVVENKIEFKALVTEEERMIDILTNEELDEAIKIGLGPEGKLDVLLMMNCYMMNVMACYALKDRVKYLVAPQGTISRPGYNYQAILKQIADSISNASVLEAGELAKLCVDSCGYESDMNRRQQFKDKIDDWDIIALSLKNYDIIASTINAIANTCLAIFKKNNNSDPDFTFDQARCLCRVFNDTSLSYEMIDIGYWLIELIDRLNKLNVSTQELSALHFVLNDILSKQLIAKRNSNWVLSSKYETKQMLQRQATGVCLYFPLKISLDDDTFMIFVDGGGSERSRFITDKKNWLEFLLHFSSV